MARFYYYSVEELGGGEGGGGGGRTKPRPKPVEKPSAARFAHPLRGAEVLVAVRGPSPGEGGGKNDTATTSPPLCRRSHQISTRLTKMHSGIYVRFTKSKRLPTFGISCLPRVTLPHPVDSRGDGLPGECGNSTSRIVYQNKHIGHH